MGAKYLIASDIHGSAYYCRKLIEIYKTGSFEKLILLGDLLYHGPRNDLPKEYNPKAVIEMLNGISNDILCVRGNCEAEVDQMVLEFPVLAEYALLYIDKKTMFATHGHKFNPENLPPLKDGDVLLNGHTHIPKIEQIGNITYVNPGSVSLGKSESGNTYIVYENDKFIINTLN